MTHTDEISTEILSSGTRYVLPIRNLGMIRRLGWPLVAMGIFTTCFTVAWMAFSIIGGIMQDQAAQGFSALLIGFGLLGLFGLIPALGMLLIGFTFAANRSRCVVEIRNGKLYSNEPLFLFTWRRRRPIDLIRELSIESLGSHFNQRHINSRNHSRFLTTAAGAAYGIVASGRDTKKFLVAPAYPKELLVRLANEIAEHVACNVTQIRLGDRPLKEDSFESTSFETGESRPTVIVRDPSDGLDKQPVQPAGSDASVERRKGGVTITIPPAGLWKGSRGLFFFSLVWNGFLILFVGAFLFSVARGDDSDWNILLFLIPFIAVGVGVMLIAVNMGRRRAIIATSGENILVVRESIFGKSSREWRSSQIQQICSGPSGMSVNDVPVHELQVHSTAGKKFGCLSQRDDDELEWIAAELNRSLRLATPGSESSLDCVSRNDDGETVLPVGSKIRIERDSNRKISRSARQLARGEVQIVIPALGLKKNRSFILIGLLFTVVGIAVTAGVFYSELKEGGDFSTMIFVSIWATLFVGGGFSVFFYGLVKAYRQLQIFVCPKELVIDRSGLFGNRTFRWDASTLEPTEIVDSGVLSNATKFYQLL
ncbi:MAG: hypothetical protein N2C12_02730, partial [Planctomycetales bacterium]